MLNCFNCIYGIFYLDPEETSPAATQMWVWASPSAEPPHSPTDCPQDTQHVCVPEVCTDKCNNVTVTHDKKEGFWIIIWQLQLKSMFLPQILDKTAVKLLSWYTSVVHVCPPHSWNPEFQKLQHSKAWQFKKNEKKVFPIPC